MNDPATPTPQHFVPPAARELRAQSVHRLQVGVFGLAAMLLLAGLVNIVMDRVRISDAASGIISPHNKPAAKNDPLADIGVAPQTQPSTPAKPHN